MKIFISHETRYFYSRSVFIEPHIVRLVPRATPAVRVYSHTLRIDPEPSGHCVGLDTDGNHYHELWFGDLSDRLTLVAESEVERRPFDPLNFILHPLSNTQLPVTYPSAVHPLIQAYMPRCANTIPSTAFATDIAQEVGHETVPFLLRLTQRISQMCERIDRPDGAPYAPDKTLRELKGSCRDLSVLFIDACRAVGLPARFVSGYVLDETSDDSRELHAWAEVYLPGAGWRGFDPSSGIATGNEHLALAAGRVSALAAPVEGTIRGSDVRTRMEASIQQSREVLP